MNSPFQIKICGITTPTEALMVCNSGADAIGINFYPGSPRFVTEDVARQITTAISQFNSDNGCLVAVVGVFVNRSTDQILKTIKLCSLDAVQFHGDESPEIVVEMRRLMIEESINCQLIRAIRSQADDADFERIQREIDAWTDVGCDAILLDAAAPGQYGGTGNRVKWEIVSDFICHVPLVLAGGLSPANVAEAIRVSAARAVDTASGVESAPGKKDKAKVQAFVGAARGAMR